MKVTLRRQLISPFLLFPSVAYDVTVCCFCGASPRPVPATDDRTGNQGSKGAQGAPLHCFLLGSLQGTDEVSVAYFPGAGTIDGL